MKKYILGDLFESLSDRFGDGGYIYEREGERFSPHTYKDFQGDVRGFGAYLQRLGLSGEKIGIYGENSYGYMVADIAVMTYVGTSVCISKEWRLTDLLGGIEAISPKALIYSKSKADTVNELKRTHPNIIYIPMESIIGRSGSPSSKSPIGYDKCSKIVFSSGTTGIPKAVMLSQKNMFSGWNNLYLRAPMNKSDRCYMFLPLSHTYASICIFLYSLLSGMNIYICSDTARLQEEIMMCRPTVFCTVPLILERTYAAIKGTDISPLAALGGSVRFLFCGGAPLSPELKDFYIKGGVKVLNAYALSETSSIFSIDYPDDQDLYSVGTIFENIDVKIKSPDDHGIGEITVKGDNVFIGYCNEPSLTARAFDADGYFLTGDLGRIEGKRLYITGRKKRLIILSNGENIYPEEIEARFANIDAISKVKTYEKNGTLHTDIFVNNDIDIENTVKKINQDLPRTHRIKNYSVIRDSIDKRLK